jgi:hypothetical protein
MSDAIEDARFEAELQEMLVGVGERIDEQQGREQACAAFNTLLLLGLLDFSRLGPELNERWLRNIFSLTAYAVAGSPVVQSAIVAAHPGIGRADAISKVVRALSPLFGGVDPEPLITKMLGS